MRQVIVGITLVCAVLAFALPASGALAPANYGGPDQPRTLRVTAIPKIQNLGLYRGGIRDGVVRSLSRARTLASSKLYGGAVRANTGEVVQVFLSDLFVPDAAVLQSYADFFASLIHGAELPRARVFVVTYNEMVSICSEFAEACYYPGAQVLYLSGEDLPGGVPIEEVAAHEYGHHVATNRNNAPWRAGDWGTKRWASAENICHRVTAGTAFPADEESHYSLNSGEAFAESYRVFNDIRAGAAPWPWDIIDPSFYPSSAALDALEQDVRSPWSGPRKLVWKGKFARRGSASTATLNTPLDGDLTLSLRAPAGTLLQIYVSGELVASTRTGSYSGTICGTRAITTRVVGGKRGSFAATASIP